MFPINNDLTFRSTGGSSPYIDINEMVSQTTTATTTTMTPTTTLLPRISSFSVSFVPNTDQLTAISAISLAPSSAVGPLTASISGATGWAETRKMGTKSLPASIGGIARPGGVTTGILMSARLGSVSSTLSSGGFAVTNLGTSYSKSGISTPRVDVTLNYNFPSTTLSPTTTTTTTGPNIIPFSSGMTFGTSTTTSGSTTTRTTTTPAGSTVTPSSRGTSGGRRLDY